MIKINSGHGKNFGARCCIVMKIQKIRHQSEEEAIW